MKKATQSSERENEWVPAIGETIYVAGSSKNNAAWDDSELIDHWDAALEQYRRYHSQMENGDDEQNPFNHYSNTQPSSRKPTTGTGTATATASAATAKRRRVNSPKKATSITSMPPPPPLSTAFASSQKSIPPPPPPLPHSASTNGLPFVSHQPPYPGSSQDADMANLIMAWYYCGYYMGYYQGSKQQE
ncbi:hypothetical protein K492DRAFT_208309 [Lichtheimia hyalospora FSU 10163]|nr:hypothetical protein K492DRAFT_208309 [Lichtheimia hyalospora FSU 10163]